MNRIDEAFKRLRSEKRKAFIPYVTAGDPDMKTTKRIVSVLESSGADIIELGIPFSDPLADGPTIQKAIKRSLEAGCSVRKVLRAVRQLRRSVRIPIVFMTYYNIVFNYGVSRFIGDAKASGADGVIVPDLPMEEAAGLADAADKENFHLVMLAAPTTPRARFRQISKRSRGFIYYVSLTGVTGARDELSRRLKSDIRKLKRLTKKPLCVGFGISSPAQAREITRSSDGIIVGSAIIRVIENNLSNKSALAAKVGTFARSIAKAVHGG